MENPFNYQQFLSGMGSFLAFTFGFLIVWSVVWKGLALWKAARRTDKVWFVVLLIVNTLGILEILYFYIWSKRPERNVVSEKSSEYSSL